MAFPNFKDKHLEEALFNPEDYVTWEKMEKYSKTAPTKYILIYYPKILNYFKRTHHPKKINFYRLATIYQHGDIGVVCMTGIGSPNAATVMEELIALGGKEFLNIGSAGGLVGFGTFLCEKAIRDEGTSTHYLPHTKFAYPTKEFTEKFGIHLKKRDIQFEKGISWTIDAPYRETKAEIRKYKNGGVKTVEMEASALFSVAQVRKVKIASAFVVSDTLEKEGWTPKFSSTKLNKQLYELFDAGISFLSKN
jgi:uridine phosphorylase